MGEVMTTDSSTPTPAEPLPAFRDAFLDALKSLYHADRAGNLWDNTSLFEKSIMLKAWRAGRASVAPPAAAEPLQMGTVLINGHRYRRPVITVAVVTVDGTSCVVPTNELADIVGDGGEYTVQIKTMRLAEFERMPEFGGW
jgi:hypothetical protein